MLKDMADHDETKPSKEEEDTEPTKDDDDEEASATQAPLRAARTDCAFIRVYVCFYGLYRMYSFCFFLFLSHLAPPPTSPTPIFPPVRSFLLSECLVLGLLVTSFDLKHRYTDNTDMVLPVPPTYPPEGRPPLVSCTPLCTPDAGLLLYCVFAQP